MKRFIYYLLHMLAFLCRPFGESVYMKMTIAAHKIAGVRFDGNPEYIDPKVHLDASGGLLMSSGCVVSVNVIVLTHDWSFLKRSNYTPLDDVELHKRAFASVKIGKNSFLGAGCIILPGTVIGDNCIIGAGAVVKGYVPDGAIMVGNPAQRLMK